MSRPIAITEGEPLTYGLITSIISKLNELEGQVNTLDNKQSIRVLGNNLRGADVTILCEDIAFDRTNENTTIYKTVDFSQGFFSDVPIVVATLADAPDNKRDDQLKSPAYATLTVGKVTQDKFTLVLQFVKSPQGNSRIQVNYIAIGKSKTS